MDRSQALNLVKDKIKNENLVKHMLATEAVMRALARELGEDEERWALAGLLHDIDLDELGDDLTEHSIRSSQIVKDLGLDDEIVAAIAAHNPAHDLPRETKMAKALYACDPLTGLITAAALVRPDKTLEGLKVKSLKKRFKEGRFAANVDRDQVKSCESELGIELARFFEIGITAMQGISDDLGL